MVSADAHSRAAAEVSCLFGCLRGDGNRNLPFGELRRTPENAAVNWMCGDAGLRLCRHAALDTHVPVASLASVPLD